MIYRSIIFAFLIGSVALCQGMDADKKLLKQTMALSLQTFKHEQTARDAAYARQLQQQFDAERKKQAARPLIKKSLPVVPQKRLSPVARPYVQPALLPGHQRISVVATVGQTGAQCGYHAAKNACAFYRRDLSMFKEQPTPQALNHVRKNGNYDNIHTDDVGNLLRFYRIPSNSYTHIYTEFLSDAHRKNSPSSGIFLRAMAQNGGTPFASLYDKLAKSGNRHIFIMNTASYKMRSIGHWFAIEVRNEGGTLFYRIADSMNGSHYQSVARDLQWLLEEIRPQDKTFIKHFSELDNHLRLAHNLLFTPADTPMRYYPLSSRILASTVELTDFIETAKQADLLAHPIFKDHLHACLQFLSQYAPEEFNMLQQKLGKHAPAIKKAPAAHLAPALVPEALIKVVAPPKPKQVKPLVHPTGFMVPSAVVAPKKVSTRTVIPVIAAAKKAVANTHHSRKMQEEQDRLSALRMQQEEADAQLARKLSKQWSR